MREDFSPHSIIIVSERLADPLCLAKSLVVGHFSSRYHTCAFLLVLSNGANICPSYRQQVSGDIMTETTQPSPQSILVLGAGELGLPVLRNLAQVVKRAPGSTVSVLLRASTISTQVPEKKAEIDELRSLGIQMVAADLVSDSIDQLAEVFARFDTVIGCAGMVAGRETPMKLATAALKAGVKRYFPWQFGVDFEVIGRGSPQDLFDAQLDVRELLRAQDKTEWVIISTGMFTSFLFEPVFEVVDFENDAVNALGSLDNSVTLTTPQDIGRLTAEIVFFEPRFRNQIVYLSGDTVTYGQMASILERVLERPFKRNVWTVEHLIQELEKDPTHHIKKYRAVFAQGRGVAWPKAGTFNEQQSIQVTNAEQWVRENLVSR